MKHSLLFLLIPAIVVASSTTSSPNNNNTTSTRPNFVFFFPDTLRAESCGGLYNEALKPLNITPHLDSLAAQGTTFTQAHAMHTQCSASRCTMLTGRYMHVLGHRTQFHLLQPYEENYFRLLKEAGYHIAWFGKNDVFSPASFNLSVSEWHQTGWYDSGDNAYEFGEAGYWSFKSQGGNVPYNDTRNGDTKAVIKAAEFLKSNPPEPFVLFIATRGAHPPYGAPKGFHDSLNLDEVQKAVQLRPIDTPNKPFYHKAIRQYRNLTSLPQEAYYQIQKSYLEMIRYTDWTLGVVLKALKDTPELESRTAIFASSDHGDLGGDYGLVEKWAGAADDVLTRVPLVVRLPDGFSGAKGHTVHSPVQTADILETMLDLANVTSDYIRFAHSLLPALQGSSGHTDRFVYSEGGFAFHSELFPGGSDHVPDNPRGMYWPRAQQEMKEGCPKWVMIRSATVKLVYRPLGQSELYHFKEDPMELYNRFDNASYAELQSELMDRLTTWLVLTGDVPPMRTDPRTMPSCPYPLNWETCQALMEPDPHKPTVNKGEWERRQSNHQNLA